MGQVSTEDARFQRLRNDLEGHSISIDAPHMLHGVRHEE